VVESQVKLQGNRANFGSRFKPAAGSMNYNCYRALSTGKRSPCSSTVGIEDRPIYQATAKHDNPIEQQMRNRRESTPANPLLVSDGNRDTFIARHDGQYVYSRLCSPRHGNGNIGDDARSEYSAQVSSPFSVRGISTAFRALNSGKSQHSAVYRPVMQLKKASREGKAKTKVLGEIAGLSDMIQKYSPRYKLTKENEKSLIYSLRH
jgi:hypothetical protein